jgi:hypothetical protein
MIPGEMFRVSLVIPGRREAASPESINSDRDYGFGPSRCSAGMTETTK